ncbi:YceI family protein [Oerskovia flava]|uniref:YceI family protein n=1 Tax=Oerskovia flava TaxID=2986422 RepID=UPI00223ECF65|nr:YceI family protein [Oerskovia sp. JB1-3-2]
MKKPVVIVIVGALVAALLGLGGLFLYARSQQGTEAAPLALSSATAEDEGAADAADGSATSAEDLDGEYVVGEGSQAGYRVDEVLSGQDVTVVGRTEDVTGSITVAGGSLTAAQVEVDMTTITTDDSGRDNQFLSILDTATYPTATFSLTEPVDLADTVTGDLVSRPATGELTIAGESREVTVALEVRTTAHGADVSVSIPVAFEDYGVEAPNLGFVQVEDVGIVEALLTISRA